MSNNPITQQVEETVDRFIYLVEKTAKQFANEIAGKREEYCLETLDYMSAANSALQRAAKEKGESLREGYVKESMKNAIIDARRSEYKHDPEQIDVEANFLTFYRLFLGGLNKPDSSRRRAIAEGAWRDLKPGRDEKEDAHQIRVVNDERVSTNTELSALLGLLWKRKLECLPVPFRVDFDQPLQMEGEEVDLTLGDIIPGADPTKDDSYDAMEVSDINRQIKHFINRRYVDNSQMVQTISSLVRSFARRLKADITDLVSMRCAWRLTILYLLSVESSELQRRGYEPGTAIKDIMIIPDLAHLCVLAKMDLETAVKMKPVEARTFFNRAMRQLGIYEGSRSSSKK